MNQEAGESAQSSPSRPPRRSGPRRRGGRGRRRPQMREPNPAAPEVASVAAEQPTPVSVSEPIKREEPTRAPAPSSLQQRQQNQHRRIGSPITQATAQVEDVIKSLREALRELEEVLEILDDAQRQQIGDEKEIESLRRALSALQRERQSAPREESRGRYENRGRSEPRHRTEQRAADKSSPTEQSEPEE
jgi:hypothetical protein